MRSAPELSRRIQVNSLGRQDGPRGSAPAGEIVVEASDAECHALAGRLQVPAVAALRCRFRLSAADAGGRVRADGLLTATLTRLCVASLEAFESEVVEAFGIRFVPAGEEEAEQADLLDPDADDDVPYEGGRIDLGEAAVEQLALAMEPYPRKPGVTLPAGIGSVDAAPADGDALDGDAAGGPEESGRPNPFAVLASRRTQ